MHTENCLGIFFSNITKHHNELPGENMISTILAIIARLIYGGILWLALAFAIMFLAWGGVTELLPLMGITGVGFIVWAFSTSISEHNAKKKEPEHYEKRFGPKKNNAPQSNEPTKKE